MLVVVDLTPLPVDEGIMLDSWIHFYGLQLSIDG